MEQLGADFIVFCGIFNVTVPFGCGLSIAIAILKKEKPKQMKSFAGSSMPQVNLQLWPSWHSPMVSEYHLFPQQYGSLSRQLNHSAPEAVIWIP